MVVDLNFGLDKNTVVDHNFGHYEIMVVEDGVRGIGQSGGVGQFGAIWTKDPS